MLQYNIRGRFDRDLGNFEATIHLCFSMPLGANLIVVLGNFEATIHLYSNISLRANLLGILGNFEATYTLV